MDAAVATELEDDPTERVARERVGTVLSSRWRLESLIGVGGMAAVYAARHANNDRAAAIKILHLETAQNAEVKRRFLREGYIANKVAHPGAVEVLDDGMTDDGAAYIVMELCRGETLQERIDRDGAQEPGAVLGWADRMLDVLVLAHREGIVHRDLKPDNVFVLEDGGVKILDFGIARLLGDRVPVDQRTQAGLVLGTPTFMPPEQARGQIDRIDGRSDLWALGAVMVCALTGKLLRDGSTVQENLFLAMTAPVAPMKKLAPELGPKLAALLDRALAFEPEQRWADAAAMQSEVRALLSGADRDSSLLKPAPKPAWPPPPVVDGPPIAPRTSATSSPALPEVAPAAASGDVALRATVQADSGDEAPTAAAADEHDAAVDELIATSEPPAADSTAGERPAVFVRTNDVTPVAAHLQTNSRSLESGSPLLERNRRGRTRGLIAAVAVLVIATFSLAALVQYSPGVQQALGLSPAILTVPVGESSPLATAETHEEITEPTAETAADSDAGAAAARPRPKPAVAPKVKKPAVAPKAKKPAPKPAPKKKK